MFNFFDSAVLLHSGWVQSFQCCSFCECSCLGFLMWYLLFFFFGILKCWDHLLFISWTLHVCSTWEIFLENLSKTCTVVWFIVQFVEDNCLSGTYKSRYTLLTNRYQSVRMVPISPFPSRVTFAIQDSKKHRSFHEKTFFPYGPSTKIYFSKAINFDGLMLLRYAWISRTRLIGNWVLLRSGYHKVIWLMRKLLWLMVFKHW